MEGYPSDKEEEKEEKEKEKEKEEEEEDKYEEFIDKKDDLNKQEKIILCEVVLLGLSLIGVITRIIWRD
jgi:hypothetical protein